jgi:hypothetical protein
MKHVKNVKTPLMDVHAKVKGDSVHGKRSHDPVLNQRIRKTGRVTE